MLVAVSISACTEDTGRAVLEGPSSTTETSTTEPGTIRIGETVDHSMYTHCGVESTLINGRVWNATDPLYSSPEKLGPPDGWGDPYQDGELTLQSAGSAVFAALG